MGYKKSNVSRYQPHILNIKVRILYNGKISSPTIPPGFPLVSEFSAIAAALLVNSLASKLTPTRKGVTYAKEECKYFDRESIKGNISA